MDNLPAKDMRPASYAPAVNGSAVPYWPVIREG